MSSSSSPIFSGNSRYSLDFQSIIDRSVAIASLPISQLNDSKEALDGQATAIAGLQTKFDALQTSLDAIADALGSGAFAAEVSNTSVVDPTLGSGAMEGTYSIDVVNIGAYSTAMSGDAGIADPGAKSLTTANSFTLTAGSDSYTITPAANTLTALAAAINATTAAHVRATMVNVGPAGAPDYRLSLERTELGADGIQLLDGVTPLLTGVNGAKAVYSVNGAVTQVESTSRAVTIAPGLTLELLSTGQSSITVTRQSSVLSDALASFANSYNAAMAETDQHRGDAGGVLSGQELVLTLSRSLRDITGWSADGAIASIGDLGLSFDESGVLSFDPLGFMAADWTEPAAVTAFLNSFLDSSNEIVEGLAGPVSGRIQTTADSISSQIADTGERIADQQERVDRLKSSLAERMAAADALIAAMEQQYNYLSQMFAAMRTSSEMYQ